MTDTNDDPKDAYKVTTRCGNCLIEQTLTLAKGVYVQDETCDHCGTQSLRASAVAFSPRASA